MLNSGPEIDALGRRIEKKDMLTQTAKRYYYDDHRIALQTSVSSGGSETDEKYFVYGNYIDETLLMYTLAGTYTGDFYYGHDHLYGPAVLFAYDSQQQSWEPCERYEYDVYGACRILTSGYSLLSSSQYGNPYTFTGRELDSFDNNAFRIMYYRARSYDPQTGRFLQRDPLQYVEGENLYEYVKSSPIHHIDPFGLLTKRKESEDSIVIINVNEYPMDSMSIQVQIATGAWSSYTFIPGFTYEQPWVKGAERLWSSGKCIIELVEGIGKHEAVARHRPYASVDINITFTDIPELSFLDKVFDIAPSCKMTTACSLLLGQLLNVQTDTINIIMGGTGKWSQAWERYYDTGREKRTKLEELNVSESCCQRGWIYQSKEKPDFYGWKPLFQIGVTNPGPVPNI
jgi:RHS repeat-associated protein